MAIRILLLIIAIGAFPSVDDSVRLSCGMDYDAHFAAKQLINCLCVLFRGTFVRFVLRNYGISGLQNYIRHHIRLAKQFEDLVKKDKRFEICNEVKVCLNIYFDLYICVSLSFTFIQIQFSVGFGVLSFDRFG